MGSSEGLQLVGRGVVPWGPRRGPLGHPRATASSSSQASGWAAMQAQRGADSFGDSPLMTDAAGLGFEFGARPRTGDAGNDQQKPSGNRQQRLRGKALRGEDQGVGRQATARQGLRAGGGESDPETTNGHRITMGAVIGACCKCGDLTKGLKLLQQLDGPGGVGAGGPAYNA